MNDKEFKKVQMVLEKNKEKTILIELKGIVEVNWHLKNINLIATEDKLIITKDTQEIISFNLHQLMKIIQETDKKIRFEFDPLQTVILTINE